MNYGRLALTTVVATVVDAVYGFAVYGTMMAGQFAAFPAVFRPAETGAAYAPALFGGILVGMCAIAYIYAKGYEGGSGIQEGFRFGVLIGIFNAGYFAATSYAILNITLQLAASLAIAGMVEWMIVGTAIGLVYKPATLARAPRRSGGV